jgi:hypothetical protein
VERARVSKSAFRTPSFRYKRGYQQTCKDKFWAEASFSPSDAQVEVGERWAVSQAVLILQYLSGHWLSECKEQCSRVNLWQLHVVVYTVSSQFILQIKIYLAYLKGNDSSLMWSLRKRPPYSHKREPSKTWLIFVWHNSTFELQIYVLTNHIRKPKIRSSNGGVGNKVVPWSLALTDLAEKTWVHHALEKCWSPSQVRLAPESTPSLPPRLSILPLRVRNSTWARSTRGSHHVPILSDRCRPIATAVNNVSLAGDWIPNLKPDPD